VNTPTVGDWYAVSLDESGWAACYVGRVTSEGWMLGYFFGPWAGQPTSADVAGCTAEQATFVLVVSPQAIETGDWPLISPAAGPPSELWPMPVFRRFQPVRGRHVEIELDDELRPARERWMDDPERVRSAVMYSLAGSGVPKIQAQRMMFPTPDWYPVEGEAFVTLKDGWYYPGRVARADLHNLRFLCYMFRRSTEPIDVTQVAQRTVRRASIPVHVRRRRSRSAGTDRVVHRRGGTLPAQGRVRQSAGHGSALRAGPRSADAAHDDDQNG